MGLAQGVSVGNIGANLKMLMVGVLFNLSFIFFVFKCFRHLFILSFLQIAVPDWMTGGMIQFTSPP